MATTIKMYNPALNGGVVQDKPVSTQAYWESRGWLPVPPGVNVPVPYDSQLDAQVADLLRSPSSQFGAAFSAVAAVTPTSVAANLPARLSDAALKAAFPALTRVGSDALRAAVSTVLRPWRAQVVLGGSQTYILGHSVVNGANAANGQGFAPLVRAGILAVDPTATVAIDGNSGFTSSQLWAKFVDRTTLNTSFTSLTIFMGLINDHYQGVPPATSKTNLQLLIAKLKALQPVGNPTPGFLILLEFATADGPGTTSPWSEYVAVAKAVADEDPSVGILDLGARMGSAVTDTQGMFAGDKIHPTTAGHALITRMVLTYLLAELTTGIAAGSTSGGSGQLAVKAWNPSTKQVITTSATVASPAAVNATEASVTVVVPTSGKVLFRASAEVSVTNTYAAYWAVLANGTLLGASKRLVAFSTAYDVRSYTVLLTGLTPGQSLTLALAHYVSNVAATATLVAGGATDGPLMIEAWDAPAGVYSTANPA